MDGQIYGWIIWLIDGYKANGWMDGWIDKWPKGWFDKWMYEG